MSRTALKPSRYRRPCCCGHGGWPPPRGAGESAAARRAATGRNYTADVSSRYHRSTRSRQRISAVRGRVAFATDNPAPVLRQLEGTPAVVSRTVYATGGTADRSSRSTAAQVRFAGSTACARQPGSGRAAASGRGGLIGRMDGERILTSPRVSPRLARRQNRAADAGFRKTDVDLRRRRLRQPSADQSGNRRNRPALDADRDEAIP